MNIVLGKSGHKNLAVEIDTLLVTRMLIQADSGGGKTWLMRVLAEQFFGKVQVIIIDPEGEFATLREKYGYVLVGKGGETPADTRSAALLAHRLLELKASAVCDIYEMKSQQRHTWVRLFLEAMIDAPKNLWHPCVVIVDEAHIFCPEKGKGESEASQSMIDLCTRGRKRGYCAIFATQRLSVLNKDASGMLLNRLIGPTFESGNVERAIKELNVAKDEVEQFRTEIKTLDPGHFYAFGRAVSKERVLFTVGHVQTTHAEVGSKHSLEPPPPPDNIAKLLPKLSDLPKAAEEKAKTEADLRKEIRDLKTQLRTQPTVAKEVKVVDQKAIERAVRNAEDAIIRQANCAIGAREKAIVEKVRSFVAFEPERQKVSAGEIQTKEGNASKQVMGAVTSSPARNSHPRPDVSHENNGHLPEGEREILKAIAKYADGVKRDQLSVLSGYKRSTRDAYIARLRPKGYIDERGGLIVATESGIAALGDDYEQFPPGGDELKDYWLRRLPDGEKKLLEILLEHPDGVDREALTEATSYKRSTRDAYLARMTAKRIIESSRDGVKAVGEFFN